MGEMGVDTVNFPVCITFTPEGEEKLGLSRPKDRVIWAENNLERSPEEDMLMMASDMKCEPQTLAALKMPSPTQVVAFLGFTEAILNEGKKVIIAIFDLYNTVTGKGGSENKHSIKAVVVPDEIAENFKREISEKENLAA